MTDLDNDNNESTISSKLLDEYVDILENQAGKYHKYQYILLFICIFNFMNSYFVQSCSPLLEYLPTAKMLNTTSGVIEEFQLTKEVCHDKNLVIQDFVELPGFSAVTTLNFYCDDVLSGILGSSIYVGYVSGVSIIPLINNYFGRKKAIIIAAISNFIICILSSFSSNKTEIIIAFFMFNLCSMVVAHSNVILLQENVTNMKRSIFTGYIQMGYIGSIFIMSPILYFSNSWHVGYYINGAMFLIGAGLTAVFTIESPKTYIKKNDYEEYLLTLYKISHINRKARRYLSYLMFHGENLFVDTITNDINPHFKKKILETFNQEDIDFILNFKIENYETIEDENAVSVTSKRKIVMKSKLGALLKENEVVKDSQNYNDDENNKKESEVNDNMIVRKESNYRENDSEEDIDEINYDYERRKNLLDGMSSKRVSSKNILNLTDNKELKDDLINEVDRIAVNNNEEVVITVDFAKLRKAFNYNQRSSIITSNSNFKKRGKSISSVNNNAGDLNEIKFTNEKSHKIHIEKSTTKTYSYIDLIKYPSQRYKFLNLSLIYFLCCALYFGNTMNIKNLKGNILKNCYINGAFEFLGYFSSGFMMNSKLGRKGNSKLNYLSVIVIIAIILILFSNDDVVTYLSLVAKAFLASNINNMFVICGESYPIQIISQGYSANTFIGKLGAIIISFVVEVVSSLTLNIMFICFALINLILFFLTDETKGKTLELNIPEISKEIQKKDEIHEKQKHEHE